MRTSSPAKRRALTAIRNAAQYAREPRGRVAAECGIALALLEIAFQLGRIADNVPLYGPAEEHNES
jgi:hypothetical protein